MKTTKLMAAALAFAAVSAFAMPEGWTDDFDAAKAKAAKEGKLLLVDFSGSDWCGWCKKLDKEVFAEKEFVENASKDFVLVMIDSPSDTSILSEKAKEQNPKLVKEYKVRGFPTVLIMDAEGKQLRKTGYRKGGPKPYLEELAKMKKSIEAGEDPEAEERAKKAAREAVVKANWTDDFDAAKAKAAKEGKLLLVDFSGSDWCGWCMKLDEEVFSKKKFIDEAKKDFVLVLIDSPKDESILSEKAKGQNPKLVKEYDIEGFPTVLILDAEGKKLKQAGYHKGGPKAYLKMLGEMKAAIKEYEKFKESVAKLDKGGAARLAKIDEFLQKVGEEQAEDYGELVDELLANDKDGKFAAKYPKFAYVKPAEAKFRELFRLLNDEMKSRVDALGRQPEKEDLKKIRKEVDAIAREKLPEIAKAVGEIKDKAPESVKKEIAGILKYVENLQKQVAEHGDGDGGDEE